MAVRFRGTEAEKVTLTVIQRGVEEVGYRGDVDSGIDWEAADLAAGEYLALAQEKNGTAAASARVTLAAGQSTTVTLALAEGEAEAPLELMLDVAEDRELGSSLRLVHRYEAPGIQELGTEDLLVADLAARPAAPGRRRLAATLEALPAGRGLVGIEELLVEAEFVHDPTSPAPVVLVVPDFVELEVTTVDRETGAIVQTSSIEVDCRVDNTVRWSEEFDSADAPGHFRIRCPGRGLSVQVESGHGYLGTSVPLDASSARSVEVPLAPIPSLLVGLIAPDGDPVDWPAGAPVQLHREDRPAATARAELERGGVRLWVSEGGYWTLNLPEIDGFQPNQTQTLWFGEDTEPSMVRYGIAR